MLRFWRKIRNIGVTEELDDRDARRVANINFLALISVIYVNIRGIVVFSDTAYFLKLMCFNIGFSSIWLLNYLHYYNAAAHLMFLLPVAGVIYLGYFYLGGVAGGGWILLFAGVPFPLIVFGTRRKAHLLLSLGTLALGFVIVFVLDVFYPVPLNPNINHRLALATQSLMVFAILVSATWHFYSTNLAAETQLRLASEQADAASRAKSAFLATVSHEFRTPMNAIVGFTDLALRREPADKKVRRDLQRISSASSSLLTLLNDILDFSAIEADKLTIRPRPFSLQNLVDEIQNLFGTDVREKGLEFQCRLEPGMAETLVGDLQRVRQVLTNLVGNAVKFTKEGEVELQVSEPDSRPGFVEFRVSDSGIGIPSQRISELFQPFSQLDSALHREVGGSGLGLAICRKLVDLMGGVLEVESVVGQGSTFFFCLPIEGRTADSQTPAPEDGKDSPVLFPTGLPFQGYCVLVVDDVAPNRELAEEYLRLLGASVLCVSNGPSALEQATGEPFDTVLMDVSMPGMDGYETARLWRDTGDEDTPIIAMTAHAGETARQSALDSGMNDHLTKPVSLGSLYETLARWLAPRASFLPPPTTTNPLSVSPSEIDREEALERLAGSEELLRRLIRSFCKKYRNIDDELRALLDRNQMLQLKEKSDELAIAAGNIAAGTINSAASRLSQASDKEEMMALIEIIASSLSAIRSSL